MLLSMNDDLRHMAVGAPALAQEHLLAGQLLLARLGRVEPPERIELRRRREIDDVLHLRHHRHLVVAVGQVARPCAAR